MNRLDQILARTFPGARNIVVLDQLAGYRRKHDTQVLLVEVDDRIQGGPCVVKIGPIRHLDRELQGWNCSRPVGLRHDLVLLPLAEGVRQSQSEMADGEVPWMSLVYGDAQQFIGVERTVFLEEAVLDAVQYGNPSVQSIGFVLAELLERLGHLLYATSFVENPDAPDYVFRMPRVVRGLNAWKSDPLQRSVRTDTNVLVNHGASRFIDPVDYFDNWILPHFRHIRAEPNGMQTLVEADIPLTATPTTVQAVFNDAAVAESGGVKLSLQPVPHDLVPRMLRGCAHGDLHGRNILVGLIHDRAMWPTVFDYEDMSPCELPGWDFVKLETELKFRAWRDILSRDEPRFLLEARAFELELDELTERYHHDGNWPAVEHSDKPLDRLRSVVLEIRRLAAIHLGRNRGRSREWLEEYYFLLAAYGVNVGGYQNLDRRELAAVYVAAGVAVSRLSWPIRREAGERGWLGL